MNFLSSFLNSIRPRCDDDVVDRLNYYYTCMIIIIFSITISAKQYVGQPIQCWVPAHFTGAWEQYAENYCFVQNTYWWSLRKTISQSDAERESKQIGYYQWVPFILAIEAMLFYSPVLVWRLLNWQSGIHVQCIVEMATETKNIHTENRETAVKTISKHIEDAIELQRDFGGNKRGLVAVLTQCGKTRGAYVTILYLLVKLMYIGNVVGQFFLLSAFLGPRYHFWGAEILRDLANGKEWEESGHFPRVTMCDFEVRVVGNNLQRHTIQCVLMINMFNEKIFLFLWWWFLMVALVTGINFFHWLFLALSKRRRLCFVARYLRDHP